MPSFRSLLSTTAVALSLTSPAQSRPAVEARQASCNCYKATSDSTAHFVNRKFFDFRHIANPSTPAAITGGRAADAASGSAHSYFSTSEWSGTWGIQNWETTGQGVYRVNSKNNVFIAPASDDEEGAESHLTMRTLRWDDYQSTAEVESRATDYQFLSVRMRARTRGSGGAVTALFTYFNVNDAVQEGDIEIRTDTATNVVQYTNQPGTVNGEEQPAATRIVELPSDWTEWQEHRYDWTPGSSDWFVDGQRVASIQFQTPTSPLSILLNVWSDGGVWSGVMAPGGQAEMQIQWLDLAYNSTTQPGSGSCSNVCVINDLIYG